MSIVKDLSESTVNRIVETFGFEEKLTEGNAYMTLNSPMSPDPVGQARLFEGKDGEKLVYIGLTVPAIQLDSHMVFSFSKADSILPHFTLDAVHAGPHYAFHLDLIPKVDLTSNLAYVKEVYQPLDEAFSKAEKLEGLSEAHLTRTQLAVMSPWMIANRATEDSMDPVGSICGDYLDHWINLAKKGIQSPKTLDCDTALKDHLHRSILFSKEVDPVWDRVEKMIGVESSEKLRSLLLN